MKKLFPFYSSVGIALLLQILLKFLFSLSLAELQTSCITLAILSCVGFGVLRILQTSKLSEQRRLSYSTGGSIAITFVFLAVFFFVFLSKKDQQNLPFLGALLANFFAIKAGYVQTATTLKS